MERLNLCPRSHSLKRTKKNQPNQDDLFCDICNMHQRVVYQLLSNYIPDEDDENYTAYYDNADSYRQQLEERYPLACLFGISAPSNHSFLALPSQFINATGSWTLRNATEAMLKINISSLLLRPSSSAQLLHSLSGAERSALAVTALAGVSIMGLFWDPLEFAIQRAPQKRTRTRRHYAWARMSAAPLLFLQLVGMFSWASRQELTWMSGLLLVLHISFLWAFLSGRRIQEPIGLKFDNTATRTSNSNTARNLDRHQRDVEKANAETLASTTPLSRHTVHSTDDLDFPGSGTTFEFSSSRPSSPDINEMNWSPRKPGAAPSSRLPAAFGSYRDSSFRERQESTLQGGTQGWTGNAGSFHGQQPAVQSGYPSSSVDSKFRARAYQPSPLADPSFVTNMGLSNMSLGEMFGFPSAKFQPPENHFAHRSQRQPGDKDVDAWSYRKPGTSETLGRGRSMRHRAATRSRFSVNADMDMDDEDEEEEEDEAIMSSRSALGMRRESTDFDADADSQLLSAFGRSSATDLGWGSAATEGREPFAAQRYFPQGRETGLEDNFFGIVKIVDDYLPPQEGPRTIAARNLMLKKRMARRWVIALLLCRSSVVLKALGKWPSGLDWTLQLLYVGLMLHATAFWIVDEYRAMRRFFDKTAPSDSKNGSRSTADPFEPTALDKVCSHALLLLLATRTLNLGWILSDKVAQSQGWTASGGQDVMDWSLRVIRGVAPWIHGQDTAEAVAWQAGWTLDGMTVALLVVLMTCGAGPVARLRPMQQQAR
ncbi:hypothetical protein BGZ98_008688 [Dissophora globulifera]|nr:hypothetical protein BGZ98_008688 [Dissophora globulifera]